jgi:hypothetical protein
LDERATRFSALTRGQNAMTITAAPPIVVRLFEPISLLFPQGAHMPSLRATVPPPNCILCEGPASPPSRMGWAETPDRQAVFVVCGSCSNCDDAELERRITAKLSDSRPPTSVAAARTEETAALAPLPAATALSVEAAPKADIYPQPAAAAHGAQATWVKAAAKAWTQPAAPAA